MVTNILSRILGERNKISGLKQYILQIQEKRTSIQSGVMIFIDDLDQTLEDILREGQDNEYSYAADSIPHSTKVWMVAQMGLVRAIYNISRQNYYIKIHATIRREAYEVYEGELKANFGHHISVLSYDKNEIREIFYKNISFMERNELSAPDENGTVNQVSHKLYEQYTREIVPDWDEFQMETLLETAGRNVFPALNPDVDPTIYKYYYNLGLIGYVRADGLENQLIQIFHPAGTYNYQQLDRLPNTEFYLIHSVLDSNLIDRHTYGNFYDDRNIIGHGYPFYSNSLTQNTFSVEAFIPAKVSGNRW